MSVWTPEAIALLGTMMDKDLGALLGVKEGAVQTKRSRMGIPSFKSQQPPTPPFDRKSYEKEYRKIPDVKERRKQQRKAWLQTEKGQACLLRCKNSESGKAARKRYWESDKGKAAKKRARAIEKEKRRTSRPIDGDQYADWIISQLPKNYL